MSSQTPLSDEEIADTIRRIGKFKVAELKDLSRSMELRLTGKKQELNDRIVQFLEQGRRFNDNLKLLTIRTLVLKRQNHDQLPSFKDLYGSIQSGAFNYTNVWNQYMKHDTTKPRSLHSTDSTPYKGHSLYFTESPFYQLKRMVHGSPQVAFPSKGRVVCDFNVVLNQEENELLLMNNPLIRFYLLCGVQGNTSPSSTHVPLQFPNPLEIHVNGHMLKENVKGIKGKPGTSKPGDITSLLKKSPEMNKIQMVYTTTNDTYLLYLYIVEVISCEVLINSIVSKPHIHMNSTISQICKNAADEDDDLVVSNSVVTLKDPLSYTRMTYPAQSIYCSHVECFDALIFLESQKQLPTWSCPHCHKTISIDDLAISDYLLDIISKVPQDVDHVIINQDGTWETEEENKDQEKQTTGNTSSITTKKEVEETMNVPDVIEIVSLDSESEDDVDVSMAGPNVQLQESRNSMAPMGVINGTNQENTSSSNTNANIESVVLNDSETDSDDERPLARRNRRPPIISTSPKTSSASSSSQPQFPQMYEFSASNTNRMDHNRNIIHGNEGNGAPSHFSSTAPVGYNTMSNYPHIQPKIPNIFQPNNNQLNNQPNMSLSHMVHNAGHSIPTHRYVQNQDIAHPNYGNIYPEHVSHVSRNVIHPSMSQTNPSNIYPKGFQNILMLQQRQQQSRRQLQDKYNEMTLLMQKNIKQGDNRTIRSQPHSPVVSRLPDVNMSNHSSFRKIAPSTSNDHSNFAPMYRHVSAPILGVSRRFSTSSGVNFNNGRNSGNNSRSVTSRDSQSKGTGNLNVNYGINTQTSDFEGTNNSSYNSTSQEGTVPYNDNIPSESNMTTGVSNSEPMEFHPSPVSNNVPQQNPSTNTSEVSNIPAIPTIENQENPESNSSSTPQVPSTDQLSNNAGSIEGNLGMRFSKSVFELSEATKGRSNGTNNSGVVDNTETPASKKQKIVGLLGISLDDDIFPLNGVSDVSTAQLGQEYQVSPINGRINNIQLETPRNGEHSNTDMESGNNSNPEGDIP